MKLASVRLPFSGLLRDDWRPLAWINSICALFLLVGIFGLRPQTIHSSPVPNHTNIVPVVFTPEVKPQELKPVFTEFSPTRNSENIAEVAPRVVAVAAPADVAFPVPVQGPVTLVAPRYAAPPPSERIAPTAATTFTAEANPHGYFPKPKYPASELSARHQGRVMLSVVVARSGKPQTVAIKESSGWTKLDDAALEKVRNDWDFGPGPVRYYYVPLIFRVQ